MFYNISNYTLYNSHFMTHIFLFKKYNILILYEYRYYCDFNILFNFLIP